MPLKLVAPRQGKSPNWTIRGAYLGVRVDQTTGTSDKRLAARILAKVRDEIERGTFSKPGEPTFADAALKYLDAGGEKRFVLKLAERFGETPLARIDQAAIDEAARALYPRASPATRNRQVYSPVSAILKTAGVLGQLKRPKGAKGNRRLFFFTPEQAGRVLEAAAVIDAEFGLFVTFLLYSGARLSEALNADLSRLNIAEAWTRRTATRA
jgi:integrase